MWLTQYSVFVCFPMWLRSGLTVLMDPGPRVALSDVGSYAGFHSQPLRIHPAVYSGRPSNFWASQAAPVLQDLAWYNRLGLGVLLLNTKLAQDLGISQDHWRCRLLGPPWHLASAHISEPSSPWGKVQRDKLLKRKATYRTLELQMFASDCLLSEHDTKGRGPPPTPLQVPGHGATRHLEGTGTFVKVSRRAIGETAFQHMIGNGSSVKPRRPTGMDGRQAQKKYPLGTPRCKRGALQEAKVWNYVGGQNPRILDSPLS